MKSIFAILAAATLLGSFALYGSLPTRAPQAPSGAGGPAAGGMLSARIAEAYAKLPLAFEANQGQGDAQVQFRARGPGYSLFLTGAEAVLSLRHAAEPTRPGRARSALGDATPPPPAVLRLKLVGGSPAVRLSGAQQLPGTVNYFIGNDPAAWRTDIPTYARVSYKDLYPGIDLAYHGEGGRLEYDFVVAPGADPSAITVRFAGAEGIQIDDVGDLVLRLAGGEIRQPKPLIYQELDGLRRPVPGGYASRGPAEIGFALGSYDATRQLVIDPVLAYSTYLGGVGNDVGSGIAVDRAGSAYVTGTTSGSLPTTAGASQTTFGGGSSDAFVTKLNPAGSALVYSTYLGGTGDDQGKGIAVDRAGSAYVTGRTSGSFPTTAGASQTTFGGGGIDAFVTKLNPAGSALVYSTYLGGVGNDEGFGIAVDRAGSAYVTGNTSGSFPTTVGASQTTFGGGSSDAFVTKLNPAGSARVYSTYLGGTGGDRGKGIAVDRAGSAYVTGFTSGSFPTTAGASQTTFGGGSSDAFVTKLNRKGSALVYSTYLGGVGFDRGDGIAVDRAGSAYVTGSTSGSFPTTAGASQTTFGGGSSDAFVTKLNRKGSARVYSTYLGGTGDDFGSGIAVDRAGSAYVTGSTNGSFPTTAGAPQTTFGGGSSDAFVTKLNRKGSARVYSTYLGGAGNDAGSGIAVDRAGSAYVTGFTTGSFPTTAGAFQTTFGGGTGDAFVAKIAACQVEDEHGGDFDFDECE